MGVAAMLCTPPCKKDGKKVVSYLHVGGQMEQATYRDVSLVKYIHIHTYRPILPVWRGFDLGLVATMAEAVA